MLLTLLRSQVPAAAMVSSGSGYSVTLHYDETSGAVTGVTSQADTGAVAVTVKAAGLTVLDQPGHPGAGYTDAPAGHFVDDTLEVYTRWSGG